MMGSSQALQKTQFGGTQITIIIMIGLSIKYNLLFMNLYQSTLGCLMSSVKSTDHTARMDIARLISGSNSFLCHLCVLLYTVYVFYVF